MTATFFYVENQFGTAGMGQSFGYAQVVESDLPLDTCYDQTGSLNGPYSLDEAEAVAAADNKVHDAYREAHD
jgi:hypothetical protein